ncbi:MAG: GNAT family N-acetyltransferase [Solibacillus sp.]
MKYILRLANENDISGLCNIRNNKDLFKKYLMQFEKKEVYLVIAEQFELILGFGVLKLKGTLLPKLSDLYVKEEYRGNSVGSDLIKYRENIARDLGYYEIFVSVDPIENPKMIKLIKKHGYEAISDPYLKEAVFFNDDGTTYNKTYTRIDMKKLLI